MRLAIGCFACPWPVRWYAGRRPGLGELSLHMDGGGRGVCWTAYRHDVMLRLGPMNAEDEWQTRAVLGRESRRRIAKISSQKPESCARRGDVLCGGPPVLLVGMAMGAGQEFLESLITS